MGTYKPTLLIDFDGVIGEYDGKFVEGVVGKPMPNARKAVLLLIEKFGYKVKIFTTRPPELIKGWLAEFGFPPLEVTNYKCPAFLQIDDRAICFQGTWNDDLLNSIKGFKPWWKQPSSSASSPERTE